MKYKSSVQLLALNDDCFLELFTYLSVEDLCTIKQANLRLWNLVEYYFQSIYTNKAHEVRLSHFDSTKLNEILQQCGKFIRQLVIESPRNYSDLKDFRENFDDIDDDNDLRHKDNSNSNNSTPGGTHYIGDLIGKYCSNKLQRLRLQDVYLSGFVTTVSLAHVLNNLNVIELEKCVGAADQFMRHCSNVHTIVQRNCAFFLALDQNYLLQNEYPQLERLIIYNENQIDLMVPEVLHAFFELPRNLTCLHYINRDAPTPTEMLPQIVRSGRNLTELCIELETFSTSFTADLRCLLELSHLKRLEFNTDEIPVNAFINELANSHDQLECIGISDVCLDESLCQAFMKFTRLNVLKLIAPLLEFDEFFLILSQRLVHLQQLYLVQCSDIRFANVMAFVENCPQLNALCLYESPPMEWSVDDSFEQFSIDFVHLYKMRERMIGAASIDIYFDSSMVRLIEEHVWPHEYEWFTKNGILRLKIADDQFINELPGYCPKIDNRY